MLATVLQASIKYAWRMKKREASFFVGVRDVDAMHQEMLDRGYQVTFQDAISYGQPVRKMTLRW